MVFVPKHDVLDNSKILFTKDEKYFVEDSVLIDNIKNYIVSDNQNVRNYISINGTFINHFLIG